MRVVVYTASIGGYDTLNEPRIENKNVDLVCFTDRDIKSDAWKIKKVLPLYKDNTRTARKYKALPHRWFPEYDVSVWIDGNKIITGDVLKYIEWLGDCDVATFDHTKCFDARNCIYDEALTIMEMGERNYKRTPLRGIKNWKDNPTTISKQIARYRNEQYPENNGLAFTCVVVRKHNNPDVIAVMEEWWKEMKYGSRRDQLSFNYVLWKNNFNNYCYLPGDGRNDGVLKHIKHDGKK